MLCEEGVYPIVPRVLCEEGVYPIVTRVLCEEGVYPIVPRVLCEEGVYPIVPRVLCDEGVYPIVPRVLCERAQLAEMKLALALVISHPRLQAGQIERPIYTTVRQQHTCSPVSNVYHRPVHCTALQISA